MTDFSFLQLSAWQRIAYFSTTFKPSSLTLCKLDWHCYQEDTHYNKAVVRLQYRTALFAERICLEDFMYIHVVLYEGYFDA